ncbi:Hypothetical predicted protein [Paramuricea clavata]|uniref:Uncharacterized protein n=1 Tax=Paramuricea clavata TaxID=317549 RepID=A0A6S7LFJ7_PARCT|nr:Hypothetical predicted protein [Paramuricea clavata]
MDMQGNKAVFVILECRIGISKAIMTNNRVSEAKTFLDEAFILAKKLPASLEKNIYVEDMGKFYESRVQDMEKFCENLGYIRRARECFDEALRTYRQLSIVVKKPPFREVLIELKLGKLAKDVCAIVSVDPEIAMQAQRSHYDRAAEAVRQHVATGQVDSSTVEMFLKVAVEYLSVDSSEMIRLLLETLCVSEIVYGKNKSNEAGIKTLEDILLHTNLTKGDLQPLNSKELLICKDMELHLSNSFYENISANLIMLAFGSIQYPVGINTIECAYKFLLSAPKDKASTDSTAKAVAAVRFTCLGILFHNSGDLEKAETSIRLASQLFSEIPESVEREKLPFKTTCDTMKEILSSKTFSPSDKYSLMNEVCDN